MSGTYKATGINLKAMPMGEADRLLTVLTREHGLVRVVAMGSRKHNSSLAGRSGLFVVNDLLIIKGKSLDKIAQAETLESYPGLGQDLKKLTASQYLAELCLCQALSDQPQEELFSLLNEHLKRVERSPATEVLARLTHATYQLLILAGLAPQVHLCCVTRQPLIPDPTDTNWRAGFSIPTGGAVTLEALEKLQLGKHQPARRVAVASSAAQTAAASPRANSSTGSYRLPPPTLRSQLNRQLTAPELLLLQQLTQAELPEVEMILSPVMAANPLEIDQLWLSLERALRHYAQYHFDRPIRSASLMDACFLTPPTHP
ncbi:DNA repair protein RecO [Pantanalinema sp. GBBB05]|uniref:DNA repair protein RecO n=1 Tax=Pantanalinema sp. GBBB05 TaxID=2604139 RepID=UPI001D97943C|nr:DNA repair protein RecO [Pantanalinema sp. GBBB05]